MSIAMRSSLPNTAAPARAPHVGPAAAQILHLAQQLGLGSSPQRERKLIGVTSLDRGTGVTTIAKGLAATVACWSTRDVLLIDANHARPAISHFYGVDSGGLTGVCQSIEDFDQALVATEVANLWALPSGDMPDAALTVDALLCACAARFDHVIVDLPPLDSCHFTLPLWTALDGVVLVAEAERTTRLQLAASREFLERLAIPLLGAVLNKQRSLWPRWWA